MRSLWLLWLSALVLTACPSPAPTPDASTDAGPTPTGALAIEWVDASGVTRANFADLGIALEGATQSTSIVVRNTGDAPLTLTSVDRLSGDEGFRVALGAGPQLGAGESRALTVSFEAPRGTGALHQFAAQLRLNTSEGATATLEVRARSVGAFLSWAPTSLDFGYAPPAHTLTGEVAFVNFSLSPVRLTALATREGTNPSSVFSIVATDSADLTSLTVPAAELDASAPEGITPGRAVLRLGFRPVVLGPRQGQLTATTPLAGQDALSIALRGVGGGPLLDVQPSPLLDLGQIAWFANAVPASFATRALTVRNVGLRPVPADPRGNLKLGTPDGTGGYGPPYWSVTPAAGSSVSELCVGTWDSQRGCVGELPAGQYDPLVGLEVGASLAIPVRVTPNGLGPRTFELTLFTNDLSKPSTVITVSANAVQLPPCDVEIAPAALEFGLVAPPTKTELGFTIRNRHTGPGETCLVSNLELLPESGRPAGIPPVFSLVEPWVDVVLQPGASKQVMVRAWPQGPTQAAPTAVLGKVAFNLASPLSGRVEVPLSATIGIPCLTIFPARADFGVVGATCNSLDRTFQLTNTCATDVVIDSTVLSPASSEFAVVTGLAPGTRVMAGNVAPVTFSLKYHPVDLGTDVGVFLLRVTENGQAQSYAVPLLGRGDQQGLNTERFAQRANQKTDLLFVVDDSASMVPRQAQLGQTMATLVQVASSNQFDLRVGVTNTELTGPSAALAGTLHSTDAGVKIVSALTPNGPAAVAELMNVGSSGVDESCMAPATRALTAPYVNDPSKNAGFLRDDATLHVICVTDARDQAPLTPAAYANQLLNLKAPGMFSYNVIGPFLPMAPMGCVYDDPNDGAHDFMVTKTGGVKAEICSPDWPTALSDLIARNIFADQRVFTLASHPDLAFPIEVAIDGTPLPQLDPQMRPVWSYDPLSNSIIFERLWAPEPGRVLTVTYRAVCVP